MVAHTECTRYQLADTRPSPESAGFFVPARSQCAGFHGRVERREYKTPVGGIAPGASNWALVDTRPPLGGRLTGTTTQLEANHG